MEAKRSLITLSAHKNKTIFKEKERKGLKNGKNNIMKLAYKAWKMGKIPDAQMAMIFFINRFAIDHNDSHLLKLIGHVPYEQILDTYQFKKIKGKAITCLKKWVSGEWNLSLSEKIYTPFEVLHLQAKGIRPVTMKYLDTEGSVLHRKNSLDFFVHDLEHGFMFFNNSELMLMQRNFFMRLEDSLSTDLWKTYLLDKDFKDKFYYLISDMNSHREHYRAYLHSMIPSIDFPRFEFLFEEL